jgi:hypothetical protein
MSVTLHTQFEPANVAFSPVEKTKLGSKIVYVSYKPDSGPSKRLLLQTPIMSMPFGLQCYDNDSVNASSYSIDLSFKNSDNDDAAIAQFLEKMKALDSLVLDAGTVNSQDWLGKNYTREVVSEFYRPVVRQNNVDYPPTMKVKVPSSQGQISIPIFDETKQLSDVTCLQKGSRVRAIVELSAVWFMNKTFGMSFRLVQVGVVSRPFKQLGQSYAFADDGDDDGEQGPAAFLEDGLEM